MSSLQPDPIYALVDCNNFYCSCERVFNPALEKKPMAVLSNNDGCIVARSNEIKALGIPMGAPMFQYKKLLEQKKAVILSSNYQILHFDNFFYHLFHGPLKIKKCLYSLILAFS